MKEYQALPGIKPHDILPLSGDIADGWQLHTIFQMKNGEFVALWERDIEAPKPGNLTTITHIESAQAFSKSQGKHFTFWRCELSNGETVRLFNHPDESRNDFKGAAAGWLEFFQNVEGAVEPIPVTVSSDGEWLRLVAMLDRAEYKGQTFELPGGHLKTLIQGLKAVNEYIVLDTETTGTGSDARICSIAIIRSDGKTLLDTLVNPGVPIPSDATWIHGIDDSTVADAPSWAEIGPRVMDIMRDKTTVIYNAQFDLAMLEFSHKASGLDYTEIRKNNTLCAMEAFAEHFGDWSDYHGSYKWQKLEDAALALGSPLHETHSALGDCKTTLGVVKALLELYG